MEECPICKEHIEWSSLGVRDTYVVTCPRCGVYHITRTVGVNLRNNHFSNRVIANISGWLQENKIFEITSSNIENLERLKTPSFHERADKFLGHLEKETEFAGQILYNNNSWLGAGWCINDEELYELIR